MSTSSDQPEPCPDCGEPCNLGAVPKNHTCQRICLTPRRRSEGALMAFPAQTQSSSSLGNNDLNQPLQLELMDGLSLAPSSTAPFAQLLVHQSSSAASPSVSSFSRPDRALAQVSTPWLTRLAIEAGLQQLTLEVQEHMSTRLGSLQEDVKKRSAEVRRAQWESERMEKEKQEVEEKAAELEQQVEVSVEMLANLRQELKEREKELSVKQQEVCDLDRFVRETAQREASAKVRLQSFIENLLIRAERAERQLQELHTLSHTHTDGSFRATSGAVQRRSYSVSGISRCCYSPCDNSGSPVHSSGGCEMVCEVDCYQRNLSDMEADSDSWSVYSTESQECLQQHYGTHNQGDNSAYHCHSLRHDNGPVMCSKRIKKRAWLFCVFSYLDTHSLLIAAQVCKDWWSVAHHSALWTRVTLENNRISSKFMINMAQWCTQIHTLILHHLKPRSRAKKETKEEYQKNTSQQSTRFSNRCLQTIGRCWPDLRQVGVGGAGCGLQGLTSLVRNCSSLCVLELDRMSEMSQQGAAELCREGLQHLNTLIFSYTPVLKKRPGLSDILQVRVEQCDIVPGS
ncbi:F-box only protein 41 [Bagarius yarrelli]|uniref:F-box only protein 41 n=1 Tax=Bagarius yarrelli TaxID=175774 RepID=A0A556U0A9_BAGYA|nr:F-box only protein 41 [Bagarius yarrelli]